MRSNDILLPRKTSLGLRPTWYRSYVVSPVCALHRNAAIRIATVGRDCTVSLPTVVQLCSSACMRVSARCSAHRSTSTTNVVLLLTCTLTFLYHCALTEMDVPGALKLCGLSLMLTAYSRLQMSLSYSSSSNAQQNIFPQEQLHWTAHGDAVSSEHQSVVKQQG